MTAVALDDLEPLGAEVGYGSLGRHGALGYDGGDVVVAGQRYANALSTHPPARVRFRVPPGCRRFRCRVAINDDVAVMGSHASFTVIADGRLVAEVAHVRAGAPPVSLEADLGPAPGVLELVASTSAWAYCHAVWLDPRFDDPPEGTPLGRPGVITDPLQRADIIVPAGIAPVERCIVTVGSAGFEGWVDDLLGSVRAYGGCPDALLAVFALDESDALGQVAERHGAAVVRCRSRRVLDPTAKAVMYSVGSVIPAERFVCLDADMVVLGDLAPLFVTLDACPPEALLVCGEGNDHGIPTLAAALDIAYGGGPDPPFFSRGSPIGRFPLVVNDGLLAGCRSAFLTLERQVRELPSAPRWVDQRADIRWRNQFALNVALAQLGTTVELDPTWNVQLHVQDVAVDGGRARWRGREVRVLHFSGAGKLRYGDFRETARLGSRLSALAAEGQFERAIDVGRDLRTRGSLHPAVADRMAWLEATMEPPATGAAEPDVRSWASAIDRDLLLSIQQGVHHQRYRGRQLVKNPFDLAMYLQLLERERPATVVEIGSKDGGSALWLADTARALGLTCLVHSYDRYPPEAVGDAAVRFIRADARRLGATITGDELGAWPHPWLVIEDADHTEMTTSAVLDFFDPHLQPGDIVVVEDGNLSDLYPELYPGHTSGPHLGLRRFLSRRGGAYQIAAELCDLFGHNTTTASNGVLRRRRHDFGELASRPWRDVELPAAVRGIPTMLSEREQQVLYWFARHHVRGDGRIIDGGSFLGGSTAALAAGLAARDDGPWERTIVSYDRFEVERYSLEQYGPVLPDHRVGASFRPAFDANISPWNRHVEVREGDICAIGWSGEPIEVLFLDVVKTWEINDLVLAEFLPCLVPGHSVIVQQDYLWGYAPWIHLTMELLAGSVERLDAMRNGSVVYLLTGPPPDEVIGARVRELPADRQRELMDRAVARWQGEDRGLVELARAMLVAELDGPEAGRAQLAAVRSRYAGMDWFEGVAASVAPYFAG